VAVSPLRTRASILVALAVTGPLGTAPARAQSGIGRRLQWPDRYCGGNAVVGPDDWHVAGCGG
jgi:hypothetical protein